MPQFDEYQDINSQEYTNFIPIPEYHDYYEEFPTVYWENTYEDPAEEERKRERDSSSDSSSGSGTSVSSSAAAIGRTSGSLRTGGRTGGRGGRSSGGGSSAGHSSAFASASAASIMAATFIALVAVSAFVIPAIDNAELSVDMDVDYGGDTLAYMVSLTNASANAKYYVVVMEGETVVFEKEIIDGYQAGVVEGLDGTKDHRVEIRTGLIPLHVVGSETIPGQSEPFVPVETYEFTATENSIGYDVTVKGSTTTVTLGVYPAEGEAAVFTKVLAEGTNTGTVPDLMFNHEYIVKLIGEEKTYIIKAVTTDRDTQVPSASAVDFTYGETKSVIVTGLEEAPTMSYAVQSGSSVTVDESTGALTWVSPGETVIRASFAETEHYKAGYIDVTVTTHKAEQTATDSTFTFTYNGDNQLSVATLDGATVTYAISTGTSVTVTEAGVLSWVSVGTTDVTATITETDHYLNKTVTVTVTTEKATQNASAEDVSYTYGEIKSVTVTGLVETPTVTYAEQSGTSVTVDENTGALTWASAGETTIRASFAETEHYAAGYTDASVTTEKAEQTPSASPVEVGYGGSGSIIVAGLGDDPVMSYSIQSGTSVTVNGSTGVLDWAEVGESIVRASFAETAHYEAGHIDVTVTALPAVTLTSIGLNDLCDVTWEGDVVGTWTLYVCDTVSQTIFVSGSLSEGSGQSGTIETTTGWNYGHKNDYMVYVNTPGLVSYSDVITDAIAEQSVPEIPGIRLHYEVNGYNISVVVTTNDTQYIKCELAKQYAGSAIEEFTPVNGKATGEFTVAQTGNYVIRYYNDWTDYEFPDVIVVSG